MYVSGKEKIIQSVIFLALLVPPLVFSFEFTSFLYPKEISLCIFVVLLFLFFLKSKDPILLPLPLIFFLFLNVWGIFTAFYAKVPEQTLVRSAELFLVFLAGMLFVNVNYHRKYDISIDAGILLSGLAVAVSLIVQYYDLLPVLFPRFSFYDQLYSVFGNQNLAGSYLAIVAMGMLVRWDKIPVKDIYKFLCFFILLYGMILSRSRSSWFSILIMALIYFMNLYKKGEWDNKRFLYLCGILLLVILFTLPIIYERVRHSFSAIDIGWRVRLWVWDGSVRMFLSHPFAGVGFGNFYYWSPKFLADALHSSYGTMHIQNEVLTLHAHNDILELTAEAGVIGLIMAGLFYLSPLFLYRNSYVWGVYVLISVFNPILISVVHGIVAFLFLFREEERIRCEISLYGRGLLKGIKGFICGVALVGILFLVYALWLPDYRLRQAEKLLILGQDCEQQYEELINSRFATYAMYEDYAQELMKKGNYTRAYEILKKALDKTDDGNVYLMLGKCAEKLGKKQESVKWYQECLYRFPGNESVRASLKSIEDLK